MFCSNCGTQLEDNVAFCPECGTKVAVAAAPTETSTVETPIVPEVTTTPVVEKAVEKPIVAAPVAPPPQEPQKKSKAPIIVIIILLLLVIALGIAIWWLYNDKQKDKDDEWESTEAFADADEDQDEEEEEDSTPEPTEEPTPDPTEAPTPEPTEEPTPEPTAEPDAESTEDPEAEPSEDTIVWDDSVFDINTSAYEKCAVYEADLDVSGMAIKDKQTVYANGDIVTILLESTSIDLSDVSENELSIFADVYGESYKPIKENAPECVEVIYGLDGNVYRFEMMIYLENADLKELVEGGYLTMTSGNLDTVIFVSYEQTCAGLEAGGYTLVE